MVEIYYGKKRRGTASLKGRISSGPPKAYWPGLETDQNDKKITNNNTGSYNNINNNINNNNNNNSKLERFSEISHINKIMEVDGKNIPSPKIDLVNSNTSIPIAKEKKKNGISLFRSRKRRKHQMNSEAEKEVINSGSGHTADTKIKTKEITSIGIPITTSRNNIEITSTIKAKTEILGKGNVEENHTKNIKYERESKNVCNETRSAESLSPSNSKELELIISTTSASSSNNNDSNSSSTSVSSIDNDSVIKCNKNNSSLSKITKPNTENISAGLVAITRTTLKDSAMKSDATITTTGKTTSTSTTKTDTAYYGNDDAKTPTAFACFLLRKKLPVIDEVLSSIRHVLLGMVAPSLKNQIATSGGTSNNLDDSVNLTKQSQNHDEESKVVCSQFRDICEQQDKFLERIEKLESAAAKREEKFLKRIEKEQERREENLATELKRHLQEKSRFQSELKEKDRVINDLKESKRSIQRLFQSRLDEQFHELTKRETIIGKQKREFEMTRKENEDFRTQIVMLEQRKKTNIPVLATVDRRIQITEATNHVSNLVTACQGGSQTDEMADSSNVKKCASAYNHRIRRRHERAQCSLQTTTLVGTDGTRLR